MSKYPYLPLSTDAYLADTRHLRTVEHGAYLLLLMEAWRRPTCALPDDDEVLSMLAGLPISEWLTIKGKVMAFWQRDGRRKQWTQKRLLSERSYVSENRDKKRDAAASRWNKTKKTDAHAMQKPCKSDAPPPPPPQEDVAVEARARDDLKFLSEKLRIALGSLHWTMERKPSMGILAVPIAWLQGGCDLEMDILPAVQSQSRSMAERGDEPNSWKVFESAVRRARDQRLAPMPTIQPRQAAPPKPHFNQDVIEAFREIHDNDPRNPNLQPEHSRPGLPDFSAGGAIVAGEVAAKGR